MSSFTESFHNAEFIINEGEGDISREPITVAQSVSLKAAKVLGKIVRATAATAAAGGGNTGNGTCSAVTTATGLKAGVYNLLAIAATKFAVYDPTGILLGVATAGTAFTGGGLTFTLTAGGTPWVVGDTWTITVAAGSNKWIALDPTGKDGREVAAGILLFDADASAADASSAAIVRLATVNGNELDWGSLNGGQITTAIAQLNALNIFVRSAI